MTLNIHIGINNVVLASILVRVNFPLLMYYISVSLAAKQFAKIVPIAARNLTASTVWLTMTSTGNLANL